MTTYTQYFYYDILQGSDAVRVSVAGPHGEEHFRILPYTNGKDFRPARNRALDEIENEILGVEANSIEGSIGEG